LQAIVKGNYSKIIQFVLDNSVFSLSNVFLNDLTTQLFYKIVEIRLVRHRWTGGHSGAIQQVGAHKHRTKLFLPVIQKQKVYLTKIDAFL